MPPEETQAVEPPRVAVLDLDENLRILALRESVTLLDAIVSRCPTQSELHTIGRQARLRLTYVLLRESTIPEIERSQYLALIRHDQKTLAQSLERLPSTLRNLTR